jgi:hypothetical protein
MTFNPNPRTGVGNAAGTATLTFTIINNAGIPLTGLAFNHFLPAAPVPPAVPPGALQVAAAGAFSPSCGGATLTLVVGTNPIQFTGGSVAPGQACVVTIPVTTAGNVGAGNNFTYINAPVTLTSNEAAPVTAGPVNWVVSG